MNEFRLAAELRRQSYDLSPSRDSGPRISAAHGNRQTGLRIEDSASIQAPGGFEALAKSPNRADLSVTSLAHLRYSGEIAKILSWSENAHREQVAALGRYAVDNSPVAFLASDTMANYSTPILPRGNSPDNGWNNAAEEYFDLWAEHADISGRFDFSEIQRLASFAIDTDGDIGATMERSQFGDLGLRFWPTWRIGGEVISKGGYPDGVIRGEDEIVKGYRVFSRSGVYETVDANQFVLLAEWERTERFRGYSAMRRGMNDLRDGRELQGFLKLGAKIESALQAVIENGEKFNEEDWSETDDTKKNQALKDAQGSNAFTVATLLGGEIPRIDGTFKQLDSKTPGTNKLEFLDVLSACFVQGLGIPAAFLLDQKHTGPGTRAIIGRAQRRFDRRKALMSRFARWVWLRVIGDAVARGVLPANPAQFRPALQFPAIAVIDIGDAEQADREAVGRGLMSRKRYHGQRSNDSQKEQEQIIAEDDSLLTLLKAQAKRHDIPLEILLQRHGFVSNLLGNGLQAMTEKKDQGQQKQTDPKK